MLFNAALCVHTHLCEQWYIVIHSPPSYRWCIATRSVAKTREILLNHKASYIIISMLHRRVIVMMPSIQFPIISEEIFTFLYIFFLVILKLEPFWRLQKILRKCFLRTTPVMMSLPGLTQVSYPLQDNQCLTKKQHSDTMYYHRKMWSI